MGEVSGIYSLTHRVRWRIYALLFTFGCIAYFQKSGLTVAAERMMPALHLSQVQIGWLEWSLILGYTLFQFPGGLLGQRWGTRLTFTVISTVAFFGTVLTPLAPEALQGSALFVALCALQCLVGVAQGPIFPVGAGIVEAWFPPKSWAFVQGMQSLGLGFASALTAPLVAYLMSTVGWQQALLWPALPAAGVIVLWAWYARNSPREHRGVSAEELVEIGERPAAEARPLSVSRVKKILVNRSVLLLTLSYVCMNYVYYLISFWCFLYLVQERHFNVLEGGLLTAAPQFAAGLGAGVGGKLVSMACSRFGARRGFRLVPFLSLPSAGLLLIVTVAVGNAYLAVAALSLTYFLIELNEGAYWGTTMFVAREECMAATGVLNTGGNVGGLIVTPIAAALSGAGHWSLVFLIGAAFALVSALLWFGIDADQRVAAA
ncbi:MAG TPA: MFS transporter [Steroidobacteraceae bacterium]